MEKTKKDNKLALLLSGFSHLAACGSPFKKICMSKIDTINTDKYANRKLTNVILESSLWDVLFSPNCT